MRRASRLFEIIQILRRASAPLTADAIATELETSRWTIYRDIAELVGQRIPIRGEAGIGYVLDRGFDLPPLMLTTDEMEAVTLGSQWVVANAEPDLAKAAYAVLRKIALIVPADLRSVIEDPAIGTMSFAGGRGDAAVDVAKLRQWSREGRKLSIRYVDEEGRTSERIIWPFIVGYIATMRTVVAWCELRSGFRVFRTDRLSAITFLDERYSPRPTTLRRRWEQHRSEQLSRERNAT